MITEQIDATALKHEIETGKKPTRLYLGRIEFEQLKDFAWQEAFYKVETVPGVLRSEYRGLKIYHVDDESYVAVGI